MALCGWTARIPGTGKSEAQLELLTPSAALRSCGGELGHTSRGHCLKAITEGSGCEAEEQRQRAPTQSAFSNSIPLGLPHAPSSLPMADGTLGGRKGASIPLQLHKRN